MRVMLVRPNAGLKSTYVPLGLGYIAAAVRQAGHEVSILDARLERLSVPQTVKRVFDYQPDVVGLTALHASAEKTAVLAVAGAYKRAGGKAPVVLGGALVSSQGRDIAAAGIIDAAVIGEGETVFTGYLKALEKGESPDQIPGIIFSRNGVVQSNPRSAFVEDVDTLSVAWDLLRPDRYFSFSGRSSQSAIKKSARCLPLFTSRGCPFGCIYCHNVFGRTFRARSPESVVREMAMLKEVYGVREIEIEDDCFNVDLDRAKAIARLVIEKKLDLALSFPTGLRADRMDRELVDLLKQAGTYRIIYALETAVPRLQKLIRKNLDFTRAGEMIAYTADSGIMTCGFFMQGFPTETEAEMRRTIDYALGSKLHQAYFFYVNPFPGTELAERFPVKEDRHDGDGRMRYTALQVNLSEVPSATMRKINKEAYRRFHFSIQRMWRAFRVTPWNLRTLWAMAITLILSFRDLDDF